MSSPPPIPASLTDAYKACADVTRREGRNFAWGFVFLDTRQKMAMNALYAFARATDDLVDDEGKPLADRFRRIDAWRAATALALGGGDATDRLAHAGLSFLAPTLAAMSDTASRFAVPHDELLLLVEGCRDDLTPTRYATWEDTLAYCRKVAVTVGMAMLAIFESGNGSHRDGGRQDGTPREDTGTTHDEAMRRAMESIGYAFQLTNILRDIPEDWGRGRVYLPQELLRKYQVGEQQLASGPPVHAIERMLKEFADRAEVCYDAALPLESGLPPGPARTMRAMHRIYRGILDATRAQDYDVWIRRPGLTPLKKISILAGSFFLPR